MKTFGMDRLTLRNVENDVLGLEPEETDPVTIILAAQLRLRRHRRHTAAAEDGPATSEEVRRIVSARDTLLRRVMLRGDCLGIAPQSAIAWNDRLVPQER